MQLVNEQNVNKEMANVVAKEMDKEQDLAMELQGINYGWGEQWIQEGYHTESARFTRPII